MSTTTGTTKTTTARTRKAPAKVAPRTVGELNEMEAAAKAAKAPAKTTPEVANTDERKTFVCTAEGRGGKTNHRKFPQAMAFAVDVADDTAKTEAGRKGLVFRYFTDADKAAAFAAKMTEAGYDAIVVTATSKEA
jgi:hypothetical protein